jgi:hypothetical protein
MPASDPPSPRRAAVVLLRLVALAALLWLVGYGLGATRPAWHLYRTPFDDTVGHRLAGKLAACASRGGRTLVVLGASTAREGFDEGALEAALPGVSAFNGGLAGGSVDTLAVASLLLERSGARPSLVLVALHPWMLRAMDQDVVARGYADFFDAAVGGELLRYQAPGEGYAAAEQALRVNLLWPPARHARQLGRLARAGLRRAHAAYYWGQRRPDDAFEVARYDTRPMDAYRFSERAGEGFDAMIRRWERQGFLDARAYARPEVHARLDPVLRRIEARAEHVAVVVMPEHTFLRARVAPLAEAPFRAQLALARARGVSVLEHATTVADEDFLDLAHVGPRGRTALTAAVAPQLRALLERR